MEVRDQEGNLEVFAVDEENGRDDGASDEEERVAIISSEKNRRRRASDMIDSMGGDENIFSSEGFATPRRTSADRSPDLVSPDQGYPTTPNLSTPESVNFLMPEWLTKVPDLLDAGFANAGNYEQPSSPTEMSAASTSIDMDADCYKMDHKSRGKCVVFNHDSFDTGFGSRVGSVVDVQRIEQTFDNLGFTVEVHDNFTHTQIMNELEELSEADHREADCLCVFVLTHGISYDMICAKDVVYKSDKIWKPFTADKCKTLAGKPKLFFFQACRGEELDDGVLMRRTPILRTETDSSETSYKLPTHADFLIAHSSVQGFFSWRNPTEGTWFVQSLCQVLDEYADRTDLLKMMTITARKIATTKCSYDDLDLSKNEKKQVPSITSMLLRDVYFAPKQ